MQGNGFNFDASFRSRNDILFLGGTNGINYFIPEKIRPLNPLLRVSIQKIRVNDNDSGYHTASPFTLQHNQQSMEVSFAAPYYFNSNKVRFRYRLEGYDQAWKDIGGNTSVLFTSLPAGSFTFHVAASIDGMNWYESAEKIHFAIRLPFWKTGWFMTGILFICIAVIYLVYRYQLSKRLEVERLRFRISRDLHDDIGSTLSSINILAKSTLANAHETANNDHEVLLQKIQYRSQKMLDAMDDLIWNTKPGHESLESLTIRMREYGSEVLEAAGICLTLVAPESLNRIKLSMDTRKNLYLIFKEAVNNLAKYSNSSEAVVHFKRDKNFLEMQISDRGIGFTESAAGKGNGLENMRSRAKDMHAQLDILSSNGSGTTIRLRMPL